MVLYLFPLAGSFSNTLNTTEGNENGWEGRRFACFWHWHSKHFLIFFFFFFFLSTAEITTQLPGKINVHLPAKEGLTKYVDSKEINGRSVNDIQKLQSSMRLYRCLCFSSNCFDPLGHQMSEPLPILFMVLIDPFLFHICWWPKYWDFCTL